MMEPKRLIEEGTAFDRALLRAGREERPSTDYERRVILAATLGPAAVAGVAARPSLLTRVIRPQYLAVLAIGAGAAALSTSASEHGDRTATSAAAAPALARSAERDPQPTNDRPPSLAAPTPSTEPTEREAPVAVTTPDALPSAPAASVTARAIGTPARAPALPASPGVTSGAPARPALAEAAAAARPDGASLQREVELLDAVKRSLRMGDAAAAEHSLDAYDSEFQRGTLVPEAGFLRIRLLLARGERARAVALGDELLARHPNTVHAKRIRAALAADVTQAQPR